MIRNTAQLDQAVEQMGHMYQALASVYAKAAGTRQFPLFAEGPLDEIRKLREDIEAYAGVAEAMAQDAHLVMRLEGTCLVWPEAPSSVLTSFLDAFRKGIQTVAGLGEGGRRAHLTREIKEACDLRVTAIFPGSLQLALRIPEEGVPDADMVAEDEARFDELVKQQDENTAFVAKAIEEYIEIAAWASSEAPPEVLVERFPDEDRRRVLLNAVKRLAPTAGCMVDCVVLSGRLAAGHPPVALTRLARERIARALKAPAEEQVATHYGDLREIDLDKRSFVLRNVEGGRIAFRFRTALGEVAKEALDRPVSVTGVSQRQAAGKTTLWAMDIELLEGQS